RSVVQSWPPALIEPVLHTVREGGQVALIAKVRSLEQSTVPLPKVILEPGKPQNVFKGYTAVHGNAEAARTFPRLGRDDHNAIAGAGTVQRRGSRSLEHVYRFDVRRIDFRSAVSE